MTTTARVSQAVVEHLETVPSAVRVSQTIVEYVTGVSIAPLPPSTTYAIRRVRRSPHLSNEQMRVFYQRIQFDVQVGNGAIVDPGQVPEVMVRYSNDGGYTWSTEIQLSSGAQGQYQQRVYAQLLGSGRDRVWELSSSDPVFTVWLAAYLETSPGNS